jgi:hypothetical protein
MQVGGILSWRRVKAYLVSVCSNYGGQESDLIGVIENICFLFKVTSYLSSVLCRIRPSS